MINRRLTSPADRELHRATVNNFAADDNTRFRGGNNERSMHASLRLMKVTALNKSNDDDDEDDWVEVRNDTDKVTRSMHEDSGRVL